MFVYIIQNKFSGRYYIGSAQDVEARLKRHNTGRNISTRSKGRWKLIYTESYPDRRTAFAREQQIKRYKHGRAFRSLIE